MALARAFYKEAEIIILDEPSNTIDPLAEATIFKHFKELAKDKILILVTHLGDFWLRDLKESKKEND